MKVRGQIIRYAVAGISINAAAYAAYLLLTRIGLPPLAAMTLTYFGALAVGFVVHRQVTFRHNGNSSPALRRYGVTYAVGYLMNLGGLVVLVNWLHMPHAWAQGGLVLLVAAVMFTLQRLWVFSNATRRAPPVKGQEVGLPHSVQ